MGYNKVPIVSLFIFCMTNSAWAYRDDGLSELRQPRQQIAAAKNTMSLTDIGKTFVADKNIKTKIKKSNGHVINWEIPESAVLTILDKKQEYVRVGIEYGVDETDTAITDVSDVWIHQDDLLKNQLELYAFADEEFNEEAEGEFLDTEEFFAQILEQDRFAKKGNKGARTKRRGKRRVFSCYRHVKNYLLNIGKVRTYLPGGSAYMAAGILPKHGFSRTGSSPRSAPVGSVCVYSGGWHGHGHIEVKKSNNCYWYGAGCKGSPISGRKFIACFIK